MPIIAIVLSGVVSGLFLWLTRGGGLEQIDQLLRERRDIRSCTRVSCSGVMTPRASATATISTAAAAEIGARLVYARHAARQAPSIDAIVADLTDLVREKLSRAERRELETMLDEVAALHGGPTDEKERAI